MSLVKFMQSIDSQVYSELRQLAEEKGISLQEFLRAVIIPEWINENGPNL